MANAPLLAADLAAAGAEFPEHTYTYLFCDLMTDVVLAELPLSDVTYSTELNGIGTLRASIPYTDETAPLDPEAASTPGRTALYVDRDGVIVWGGIIWTRQPNSGSSSKEIQAAEFLSYYQRRYVKTTLSTDTSLIINTGYVPDGQRLYPDQKYVMWSLLNYAHTQTGGQPGISTALLTAPAHGITRNVTYFGYERPEIYKAISDLAAADDGFDFAIECGWNPAANNVAPTRYRRARTWYPRRGRTASESGLVFAKGGQGASILSYDWPEDGTAMATEISGLGDGTGEAKVTSIAQDTARLASGWPLLEQVTTYDGVIDQVQLTGLTAAELAARGQAQTQPVFEVSADTDPQFGSYAVGDEALFVIDPEPTAPTGRSGVLRIVGIENTSSSGPERVRLTCVAV
ncbi:hypothetical protein [Streptomyces scopuliridis]|uniref:Uncharacterized protein n=1 Tax=Streptomyces scopuliridis RB72 TaxID=1440053 RepID=A0A2T7SP71_9ACTN|nr:hypothetical protein [Streptomyces scopuliridis]PVE04659.1 hypothetical protein Y717_10715 [Streptomyces scopuliridis RB72]